jgi:16S rRNA (adenine1518-N6/adenine1519-N6)-dimethyltransferase
VLEIGAGLGALTAILAGIARRVVALEVDGRFIDELSRRFAGDPQVEIVKADVLEANLKQILGEDADKYKVVANLPYYITSAIIRTLLESDAPPQLIAITVQYEVAERMTARPPDMSLLALGVQFYGVPHIVGKITPDVFYPRPNVDSALVRIEPHPEGAPLPPPERRRFFRIARAGFSQPRKQLRNSLSAGLHLEPSAVVNWMERAGLDPTRRAETLSVNDWLILAQSASNPVS